MQSSMFKRICIPIAAARLGISKSAVHEQVAPFRKSALVAVQNHCAFGFALGVVSKAQ
jgi:hypothetical protein